MTEAQWLACTNPTPMLEFLRDKASKRKLQLFVCAACRRQWPLLQEERIRNAVEISERYADGTVGDPELASVAITAWFVVRPLPTNAPAHRARWAAAWSAAPANRYFAENASAYLLGATGGIVNFLLGVLGIVTAQPERFSQAGLLCDIFGIPFRPTPSLPIAVLAWNDRTVLRIAQGIYEERAFDSLAILADALLDAGCDNEDLLAHCRSAGPHVRGCWAVDLILGKS
jgi:hypothetical protein